MKLEIRKPVKICVTAAVIEREGKVLLARRKGGRFAGKWEFPGGKIERGETPEVCLMREISEELGLRICVDKRLGNSHHADVDMEVDLQVFRCSILGGELTLQDHDEVAWVDWGDVSGYDLTVPDRKFVERMTNEK